MDSNFHVKLDEYTKARDNGNATNVILSELAISLVKDRDNFIEVLRGAGLSVEDGDTDLKLIETFVNNANDNNKLLLGASFLINHRNQTSNFDGESEVSDISVKNTYKNLDEFFNGTEEEKSNFLPLLAPLIKGGLKIAGNKMGQKQDNSVAQRNQQEARQKMIAELMAQKKRDAEKKAIEQAKKKKTTKTLIIVGSSILGLVLIGAIIYAVKKK
jgi:hypothetical protein